MADNITLKIDADVSDAQSAIAKFQKTTEKAFNSSNTKIQQTGNQLNNLTHNLDRVAGKMKQLENTRFKTEEYKKLESDISKVGNEITKTETKVKKLADKKIPTTEYLNLKDRVKDLGTEIKTTESELKKWEKSDVFKATEKDVASLTRKYSEATIYAQKLLKGGVKSYDNQYIEAKNNVKALGKELRQAKAYQQSLIDSGKQYKNQNEYEQKSNKLKILKGELVAVEQEMKSMEVTGKASTNTLEYEQLKDRLEDLRKEYKQLNEEKALLDKTGAGTYSGTQTTQYQNLQDQYTGLYNRASMVNNKINEMNKGTVQVMSSTQLVKTAVDSVKSAWRTVINVVKSGVKGLTTAFKSWATSSKNAIRSVSNMFSSLFNRSVGNSTKYHNSSFKSMITMLLKYAFGIRSIFLLYKKVRSTISTGLTEMGKEFSDVQADINSLKNSWATFKSSLISAFQPIYSYVVPALVTLINYLTSAMNALANFFAIMTGKSTYKKAVQQNNDYADSVSDTGSAAKDANEELAEYDDLIVISQDKSSDSGSGGSGGGSGWQWEEVPTTTNATIDAIKKAWENADWEGLGKIISDKLTSMMNNIPWNTIYQKASAFGTGLAQFLNGLITDDLFSALGTTIANALNTVLIGVNSFAKEFDWSGLGTAIASGIESFFKSFKFDLAVDTFNTLVNGILTTILDGLTKLINDGFFESLADTIAEAIGGIDTSGFGTKLGKIATAIATALGTLVAKRETWTNLGTKIAEGINAFVANTKWDKVGFTLSATAVGIVTALATAIKKTSTADIKQAFIDLINGIQWAETGWALGDLVASIATKLYELVSDSQTWKELGSKMGTGIKNFFSALSNTQENGQTGWQNIGGTIGNTIKGIVNAITEALKSLTADDYKDIGKGIADLLKNAASALTKDDLKDFLDAVKIAIKNVLKGMNIDAGDITLGLAAASIVIASISAVKFAATITTAVLTKLAEASLVKLIGSGGLTVSAGALAGGVVDVVLAGAIIYASLKAGKYTYQVNTGDDTDYGSILTQLKEVIGGVLSGDLAKGFILDLTDDSKITVDITKVLIDITTGAKDPAKWFEEKFKGAVFGGKFSNPLSINWLDLTIYIKLADYFVKWAKEVESFGNKVKDLIFGGKSGGGGRSFDVDATDTTINVNVGEPTIEEEGENKDKPWSERLGDWLKEKFNLGDAGASIGGATVTAKVGLEKDFDGEESVTDWLNNSNQKGTGTVEKNINITQGTASGLTNKWNTITDWLNDDNLKGKGVVQKAIDLIKGTAEGTTGVWSTITDWLNVTAVKGSGFVNETINLIKGTAEGSGKWSSVSDWVSSTGTSITSTISLAKDKTLKSYKSVTTWIKKKCAPLKTTSAVTLKKDFGKNSIKSVGDWLSQWSTSINAKVNLTRGNFDSVSSWVNNNGYNSTISTMVNLYPGNFSTVASWLHNMFGAVSATSNKDGSITVNFNKSKLGGVFDAISGMWSSIPQYASGGLPGHGTLFAAGEAGPEIVGHMGGRTEVLNKSQLASTMYSAIVSGMDYVLNKISSINVSLDFTPLLNGLASIPIPVVVTGQVLPANEEFMRNREEERTRLSNIENLMYNILDKLDDSSSNHPPIMLKLDSRTVAEAVWDETEKRYKQTGRRYSFG